MKPCLLLPKDLFDSSFPQVSAHRPHIRFPAYDHRHHGFVLCRGTAAAFAPYNPQIKKLPSDKPTLLDEKFKGCLSANALLRPKFFAGLHRLVLNRFDALGFTGQRCET